MGEEIVSNHFRKQDFREYQSRLQQEFELLRQWFEDRAFDTGPKTGGFEVEAWLVDRGFGPAPINQPFLELLNSPMAAPELAAFNIELNTSVQTLTGRMLSRILEELEQTLDQCSRAANKLDAEVLMIGILPTVQERQLALSNMSRMTRYRALNEQILRLREGKALQLEISGRELLQTEHHDVMLEAAATSFQIHIKIPQQQSVRYYNAAIILSAPMVAIAANSPFLFGHDLWDETRIPLFEQAVSVASVSTRLTDRVTFGRGYVKQSLFECFEENMQRYLVLLPEVMDRPPEQLHHLRLHNGTIWRWNRPLIGFSDDGVPHLRIEHRTMPAGPTAIDTIANAAFYYGLIHVLANDPEIPELKLNFDQSRTNFYAAARNGLNASVVWLDGNSVNMRELLTEVLLPLARQGLQQQAFDKDDIDTWLEVIRGRLQSRCNGAAWQRAWVRSHGPDMAALTAAYAANQRTGSPVHEWSID